MSRQKIIDAAIVVLEEDLSASMEKIADHAGINRRTVHRHFKEREELIAVCRAEMMNTWQEAMIHACYSVEEPIKQLELMLYAGIDSGVKYAFLHKLQARVAVGNNSKDEKTLEYEANRDKWFSLVPQLQQQGVISDQVTIPWIRSVFIGMITTSIQALKDGDIAPNDIKRLAWYSFRRSIGLE